MSTNEDNVDIKQHRFETAGLGLAPFKYVGFSERRGPITLKDGSQVGSPGQPMGTCDYCGQGIAICCEIVSSDGKRFIVGSDCVEKTGDKGITVVVKSAVNKMRSDKRKANDARKVAEHKAMVENDADVRALLASKPHPQQWRRDEGETLLDSVEWFLKNAGVSGNLKMARMIVKLRKS